METASALTAPEGFAQSPDVAYFDGPEVRVQTSGGLIGAQAQWTAAAGVTYCIDLCYEELNGTELLRLASALNSLVLRSEYPHVGQS